MEFSTLKKMSVKTILEKVKAKDCKEGLICSISGSTNSIVTGEALYGSFIGFKGDFMGVRASDGVAFRSSTAFVPPIGEDIINTGLNGRPKTPEGQTKSVEFSFDIYKKNDDSVAIGYIYEVKVIVAPVIEIDPLVMLLDKINAAKTSKEEVKPKK